MEPNLCKHSLFRLLKWNLPASRHAAAAEEKSTRRMQFPSEIKGLSSPKLHGYKRLKEVDVLLPATIRLVAGLGWGVPCASPSVSLAQSVVYHARPNGNGWLEALLTGKGAASDVLRSVFERHCAALVWHKAAESDIASMLPVG